MKIKFLKLQVAMKTNIEHYPHYCNSHNHWKFKMLRVKFGWSGEGRFWALNNEIGKSDNCSINLKDKSKVNMIAADLGMTLPEFKIYLQYLIKDCKLIKRTGDIISTDMIKETLNVVMDDRERARDRKKGKQKSLSSRETKQSSVELFESSPLLLYIEKNRLDYKRLEEYAEKLKNSKYYFDRMPKKLWFEEFIITWCTWAESRAKRKKPLTEFSVAKQIKILIEDTNPVECLNTSIQSDWTGIFPSKKAYAKKTESGNQNKSGKTNLRDQNIKSAIDFVQERSPEQTG